MADPTHNENQQNSPRSHGQPWQREQQREQQKQTQKQPVSPYVKFSVFVGIFLVRILDGIPWVWGNLGVYVTSYYYAKGDESSGESTNWLITVDSSGFNFGMFLGGLIHNKIGLRITLFLAIVSYCLSITLSYFALQSSAVALCTTFGVMAGLSGGIIENCQLTLVVRWTDHYQGLAASSVPSSNILGAVLVNWVLTMFINPSNLETNSIQDGKVVFTQAELIQRVPYSFLLFGFLWLAVSLIGFLLIRVNRGDKNIVVYLMCTIKRTLCCSRENDEVENLISQGDAHVRSYTSLCNELERDGEEERKECLRHEPEMETTPAIMSEESVTSNDNSTKTEDWSRFHFTPKQVLKTKLFYVLTVYSIILSYAFFTLNTYYKAFGLLYIPDDHFLTVVVMVKCFATPVCTWIAGFCVDKFGVKPTIVCVSTIFCILASFFDLTAVNKWLYLFSTVLYGCSLFSLFCLTSATCVKLFGQTHFSTILGLILTCSNILTYAVPPLTRWIIEAHGWMALFSSVGVLALCQVLILVVGLPEKPLYKPTDGSRNHDEGEVSRHS